MEEIMINNGSKNVQIYTILIIEDNLLIQRSYAILLGNMSCSIISATTGAEALNQLNNSLIERPFDLIVLDLGLPDICGIQLCQMIRQRESAYQCRTPIVVLSSNANQKRSECLAVGCDQVVDK